MTEMEFQKVEGQLIFLRKFSLTDSEKVFQMSVEPGMKEWIPDQVYTDKHHSEEVLKFLIQQYNDNSGPDKNPIVLGICLKNSKELIGHVGLSPFEEEVEIGFAIENSQQKKGFATETIQLITNWGFSKFRLPFIWGIASSENTGSCKTLEKAGFVLFSEENRNFHKRDTLVKNYKKYNEKF